MTRQPWPPVSPFIVVWIYIYLGMVCWCALSPRTGFPVIALALAVYVVGLWTSPHLLYRLRFRISRYMFWPTLSNSDFAKLNYEDWLKGEQRGSALILATMSAAAVYVLMRY